MAHGWLVSKPWGLITNDRIPLTNQDEAVERVFHRPVQLIFPENIQAIHFGSRQDYLPQISHQFTWNGVRYCHYVLPNIWLRPNKLRQKTNHIALRLRWRSGSDHFVLSLTDPHFDPESPAVDATLKILSNAIDWQIKIFSDILNPPCISEFDTDMKRGVRRSWELVKSTWWKEGGEHFKDAEMALIAQLAGDENLIKAMKWIEKNPNTLLKRDRTLIHVSKVQELDSKCIQWLGRRSGVTAQEKSTHQQQILAVNPTLIHNILENRVYLWVLEKMSGLTEEYLLKFPHINSQKINSVKKLKKIISSQLSSEWIRCVNRIVTEFTPNYVLQNDINYNRIFEAYNKIKKKLRIIDDAWIFQRALWIDSCRQLFATALLKLTETKVDFKIVGRSHAYLNKEQQSGCWILPPCTPGPFSLFGHRLDLIDLNEDSELLSHSDALGALGAHQVMRYHIDNQKRFIAIWYIWEPMSEETLDKFAFSCQKAIKKVAASQSYPKIDGDLYGLIFVGPALDDHSLISIPSIQELVVAIRFEHSQMNNLAAIELALDNLFSKIGRQ